MSNTDYGVIHSFSREIAKKHGVNAAIILGYLGYKIQHSQHIHENKRWYFDTIDALTERYPYLGRTAIYHATKQLTQNSGPLITSNFNKKRYDRTMWYAFRDERTAQQLQAEPLYFKVSDAVAYGVLEAILLVNLGHWLVEKRKEQPDYSFHPISPKSLAKHLPFSRASIQRALNHLVEVKVLIAKAPVDTRNATLYGLSDGSNPDAVEGSIPNEADKTLGSAQNRIPNMTHSNPNMAGSDTNMGASNANMAGSDPNDYTILKDNSLEDSCLKEGCLKDNHFKAPLSVISDVSPKADALKSVQVSSAQDSGLNFFSEPVVTPDLTQGASRPYNLGPVPGASQTQCIDDLAAVPVASPGTFPAPSHSPKTAKTHFTGSHNDPWLNFLDEEVHNPCWQVLKFHHTNTNQIYINMAEAIVGLAGDLIMRTDPAELYRLYSLPGQKQQNGEVCHWFKSFFEKAYDAKFSVPDLPDNDKCREMFLEHSLCFLNMAFHCLRFEGTLVYCGKPYARIRQFICNRMQPWIDQQTALKRSQTLQNRAIQYASPDLDKENDADLSAAEKMQVFSQSLQARNRIGRYDEDDKLSQQVVVITKNTLGLARRFFQLNPQFTVAHLNCVLDECLKLPRDIGEQELDPQWHARNGYRISVFLTSLGMVAGQVNMLSQVPAFTALPPDPEDEA